MHGDATGGRQGDARRGRIRISNVNTRIALCGIAALLAAVIVAACNDGGGSVKTTSLNAQATKDAESRLPTPTPVSPVSGCPASPEACQLGRSAAAAIRAGDSQALLSLSAATTLECNRTLRLPPSPFASRDQSKRDISYLAAKRTAFWPGQTSRPSSQTHLEATTKSPSPRSVAQELTADRWIAASSS